MKVIKVGISDVLNGKVINNECKDDEVPLVMPETGGNGCLIVVELGKAVSEEVVSKDACLGETVHATAHFKVEPGVIGKLVELVLVNELLGDVSKLDADILWPVERGVEIEILEVHGGKISVTLGENTVDEQFYKFDVVAANGDVRTVSVVSLLWPDLANDLGLCDFLVALVGWDHVVKNGEEGVGAFDMLTIVGTGADALA